MLKEVLSINQVTVDLHGRDKREIINSMLDLLCKSGKVKDRDLALRDLLDHEGIMSTGMENGIAIPHAKSDVVDELIAAVGISKRKIDFECLDRKPAQIFVMTLSPKASGDPHVRFLAEIGRLLRDKQLRKKLLEVRTDADLLQTLVG